MLEGDRASLTAASLLSDCMGPKEYNSVYDTNSTPISFEIRYQIQCELVQNDCTQQRRQQPHCTARHMSRAWSTHTHVKSSEQATRALDFLDLLGDVFVVHSDSLRSLSTQNETYGN